MVKHNCSGILAGLQSQHRYGRVENKETVKAGDMGVIFRTTIYLNGEPVYQSLFAAKQNAALKGAEETIDQYADQFNLSELKISIATIIGRAKTEGQALCQQLLKVLISLLLDEPSLAWM